MSSISYKRAQAMVLADKYNVMQPQFFADFAQLANRYFEVGAISSDVYSDGELKVVITLSVKKVKEVKLTHA